MKNIQIIFYSICGLLLPLTAAFAANVFLRASTSVPSVGETVTIDVLASSESNPFNTVDIAVSYPDTTLRFTGMSDARSVISYWLAKPLRDATRISFSGMIPGGFTILTDPGTGIKKPGLIAQLYFVPKVAGDTTISIQSAHLLANDGKGTEIPVTTDTVVLHVGEVTKNTPTVSKDTTPPEAFTITESSSPLLFNSEPFIVFQTKDIGSGMAYFEVREDDGAWVEAVSPYRIVHPEAQRIMVRAVDREGNTREVALQRNHASSYMQFVYIGIFISIICMVLCVYRTYAKKSRTRNNTISSV